jgi:hypothetical protein
VSTYPVWSHELVRLLSLDTPALAQKTPTNPRASAQLLESLLNVTHDCGREGRFSVKLAGGFLGPVNVCWLTWRAVEMSRVRGNRLGWSFFVQKIRLEMEVEFLPHYNRQEGQATSCSVNTLVLRLVVDYWRNCARGPEFSLPQ